MVQKQHFSQQMIMLQILDNMAKAHIKRAGLEEHVGNLFDKILE